MVKQTTSLTSQRRITLQIFLQSNLRVTAEQIANLPIYRALELTDAALKNRIHEDLKILRESGIDVVNHQISGTHYFSIDTSDEIPLDIPPGFDATLLRTILRYHSDFTQVQFAMSGVQKLLAEANPADQKSVHRAQVVANLPKGGFIPQIARAIARGNGISFDYYSVNAQEPKRYTVVPRALVPHFESFYLYGYKVLNHSNAELIIAPDERIFRTSRILTSPSEFILPANFSLPKQPRLMPQRSNSTAYKQHRYTSNTQERSDTPDSPVQFNHFATASAIVRIRQEKAIPLRAIAQKILPKILKMRSTLIISNCPRCIQKIFLNCFVSTATM
ncbi:helix-turn-helix transcriptional regulator [Arcanobacterium hippocoleae]|uniref:helix-turn-helix transcriptional regulator n=1 Tax=Arcanobacterium hippocoleae TaxID=149017 RepID=UPI003340EA60